MIGISPWMGWGYGSVVQCVHSICMMPNSIPRTREKKRITWKGKVSAGTTVLTYPSPPWCADPTCSRNASSFQKLSPGGQTSFIIGGQFSCSLILPSCRDPHPEGARSNIHSSKAPSTAKSSNYQDWQGSKMSIPHSSAFEHQWPYSNRTDWFSSNL